MDNSLSCSMWFYSLPSAYGRRHLGRAKGNLWWLTFHDSTDLARIHTSRTGIHTVYTRSIKVHFIWNIYVIATLSTDTFDAQRIIVDSARGLVNFCTRCEADGTFQKLPIIYKSASTTMPIGTWLLPPVTSLCLSIFCLLFRFVSSIPLFTGLLCDRYRGDLSIFKAVILEIICWIVIIRHCSDASISILFNRQTFPIFKNLWRILWRIENFVSSTSSTLF